MNAAYIVEPNIVAFFFSAALCVFLFSLNRRSVTVRPAFLQLLAVGTLVCLGDALIGLAVNYSRLHPPGFSHLTFGYMIVETLECLETVIFVYYIADHLDNEETRRRIMSPVYLLFVLYLLIQVANLFTGISLYVPPDGTLVGGPLMALIVYILPVLFVLTGNLLYLIIGRHEQTVKRLAILSTFLIPVAGVIVQLSVMPHLMTTGFAVVLGDFTIYFVFETPPFKQLRDRMQALEDAGKEAERAKNEAIEADAAMNDFLANMSHEIRTPLTAIIGYDEVILKDAAEADVKACAEDIRAAGHTLLYIVNDILDFSKMASGEMTLSQGVYRLSEVLDNLGNIIRKRASDKGLEYRTAIDASIPDLLYGDGVRVNQIMINLLNNAVKYTAHGYVQLSISAVSGLDKRFLTLKVEVEDSGIGIKEEEIGRLFDAFARFDTKKNKNVEGTGLGLAITSKLLQLMGGTIDVTSVYGKGSTFRVTIPQRIAEMRLAQGLIEEEKDAGEAQAPFYAPDARLLVVDDNETNRTVVGELLRHTLIRIDTASGGMECLSKVRDTSYDVILLDQMMPHMNGSETLKRMKALPDVASKGAKVIAFTANAIAGVREKLLAEGFDDYLSKPVTASDLSAMMRKHLPREKLILKGDRAYQETAQKDLAMDADRTKSEEEIRLEQLKGIDLGLALTHCGTREVLLSAVRDFYLTIPQQADLIERYEKEGDIANYTIKVHALKSAARFIGAGALSDEAAYLERMGNEKKTQEIREKTPALLSSYRAYREYLKEIMPQEQETKGEEISAEDLAEAYGEMLAFAEGFDFDGVDAVAEQLSAYRIGEDQKETYQKIKDAIANVQRDELIRLLKERV